MLPEERLKQLDAEAGEAMLEALKEKFGEDSVTVDKELFMMMHGCLGILHQFAEQSEDEKLMQFVDTIVHYASLSINGPQTLN